MPTYIYECLLPIEEGGHGEFENYHSIRDDAKLQECPECRKEKDTSIAVRRLVAGGSGKGIMDQTVAEIKAGMAESVRKINQRAARDENYAANIIGTKYKG